MLNVDIDLSFDKEKKHERVDIFYLRNIRCQKVFKEFTSKGKTHSMCFNSQNENIYIQFQRLKRRLNKEIHACFVNTRKTDEHIRKPSNINELMKKKKNCFEKKITI